MGSIRQISLRRLLVVLAGVALAVAAGAWWVQDSVAELKKSGESAWVAPYVDTTLPPFFHFEEPNGQMANDVVLGFVVADPADPCTPSWGTYYSLDAAARALDLDRRVVRLRENGGDAVVSFGGAVNQELATVCEDPQQLVAAYQAVIDRYDLTVLDFDIEGAALGDVAANERRAAAIRELQQANEDLDVWVTLPVAVQGLTGEGVALIDGLLAAGVDLTGVNVMTMNYGGSRSESMSMREATGAALEATWLQLQGAYQRAGLLRTERQVWEAIGATPMIGRNDVTSDFFTTADAKWLTGFALEKHLGRLSYWSANRDVACGPGVDDLRVSSTCSGATQEPMEFSQIFLAVADASAVNDAAPPAAEVATATGERGNAGYDPATSPYPLWRAAKQYDAGAKVVWQDRVYEAKWWTEGDQPDEPVENPWDSPWRYLGPVLESDRLAMQAATAEPAATDRPTWDSEKVFVAGDEVVYGNQVFRAKWWTQGDTPQADPDRPYDHPWEYLGYLIAPAPTLGVAQTADGEYPVWDVLAAYEAGDTIQLNNQVFVAKWWTQGDVPLMTPAQPADHAWLFIGYVTQP